MNFSKVVHLHSTVLHCYLCIIQAWIFLYICSFITIYGKFIVFIVSTYGSAAEHKIKWGDYISFLSGPFHFDRRIQEPINQITVALLHLIAHCVKKGHLHISHVLEDGLLENYLFPPKKSKLKIIHYTFCLSKREVFWKLPVHESGCPRVWLKSLVLTITKHFQWPGRAICSFKNLIRPKKKLFKCFL